MSLDQGIVLAVLAAAMGLFVWNRLRYDIVAGLALMACVYTGVVPAEHAFEGFGHPAVITVAAVLVISQALQGSGIVELFLRLLSRARATLVRQLAANCGITMLMSAFMNNIGALALMLPITLRDARKANRPPSQLLMPLSFASLLGGLVTAIGTPPNIVVATFRAERTGEPFRMFDFTPVGLAVALAGLAFLVLASRRLIVSRDASFAEPPAPAVRDRAAGAPETAPSGTEAAGEPDAVEILEGPAEGIGRPKHDLRVARYTTEVRVPGESALVGTTVGDLELRCENEVAVMAILRRDRRRLAPSSLEQIQGGDVLILEGESEALQPLFVDPTLVEAGAEEIDPATLRSPDVRVIEAVIMPNSALVEASARGFGIHRRFGVNLLALAREGHAARARLKLVRFRVGDVLLLQGENRALENACTALGCLAIKDRGLDIVRRRGALSIPSLFAAGILAAAVGLVPIQIAFTTVVGALVLLRLISLRDAYRSIEWPVIVLLGFLIPVGEALQSTGTTGLIADAVLGLSDDLPAWGLVALLLGASMLMSDVVHNTPTAVLMAPIAFALAEGLGVAPDAFLMAVAVGAASPYLTPIGHQSNTLVMGPGSYAFGDYWRLGLPLDAVILAVAVPMICWVWL